MFNTLRYAKKFEEAGVSRLQAEAHVQIIAEIVEGDLATKQDIKDLGNETKMEMEKLKDEMIKFEYRLIFKLGALVTAVIGIAVAILKIH